MITDRLGTLKAMRNQEIDDNSDEIAFSIEETESLVSAFFNKIEEVSQSLDKISATIGEMKKKYSAILTAPLTNEKVKQEWEDLMAENKKLRNEVKRNLKALGQDIEHQEQGNNTSVNFYIKKTQHFALLRRFVDVIFEYNSVQMEFKQRCENRIERQLEIAGHPKTKAQLEEMLESEDIAIFTQGIVIETQKAKQAMADVVDKHVTTKRLEKSISEVKEMLKNMKDMIQGKVIDVNEYKAQTTADCVGTAKKELHATKTCQSEVFEAWQSESQKKNIILIIIAIIVIILGLIIGFSI